MKTVMKKMFCLMLVAVLLVGALPFAASADAVPYYQVILSSDNSQIACEGLEVGVSYSISSFIGSGYQYDFGQHKHADDTITELSDPFQVVEGDVIVIAVTPAPADPCAGGHTPGAAATCTAAQTCTICGTELAAKAAHTPGAAATCTAAQTCTVCGTELAAKTAHTPSATATCVAAVTCTGCGTELAAKAAHSPSADATCTSAQTCTVCGTTLVAALGHSVDDSTSKCTRCGKDFNDAPADDYSLKVWAKLWVGETLQKTILLDTITGLNGTEVVPYVIGNNVARLESQFPAGYKNIEWTKAVYYMIDSTKTGTVDTNMNVNEEDNVYINLYSQEKLVVVRVHTSKIYGVDRSVQVGGFRPGDVVTYDDVLKAVSKHYNVSSMKMYTYGEWEKVVAGGNGSAIPNFVVQGGDSDNVYEVYVTGSYKTTGTGTTYKADSSNPKTGDMIFAPAMVLGLSASALAVLYYLNKKRAF